MGAFSRLDKVLTIDMKEEKCETGIIRKYACTNINLEQNLSYIGFTRGVKLKLPT